MGFGGDIHPRACLHAGSISICQDSILASPRRRELDTCSALPISTNHPMVLTPERDVFFGADRHGGTTLSRGISERSWFTAWFSSLAVRHLRKSRVQRALADCCSSGTMICSREWSVAPSVPRRSTGRIANQSQRKVRLSCPWSSMVQWLFSFAYVACCRLWSGSAA